MPLICVALAKLSLGDDRYSETADGLIINGEDDNITI